MIPIAMTRAIPRSERTRRRSHRRMASPSALTCRSSSLERVSGTGAVAQHDVVPQLVELNGLRGLDVDREVDAELRERGEGLRAVVEDAERAPADGRG